MCVCMCVVYVLMCVHVKEMEKINLNFWSINPQTTSAPISGMVVHNFKGCLNRLKFLFPFLPHNYCLKIKIKFPKYRSEKLPFII